MNTTTNAPALSSLIDVYAFYSRYSKTAGRATNSRNDGKEWHGSCPRCKGHDRFSFWESGRFSCSLRASGCGWHGSSPYWFLRDEGLTHHQSCDELGIDPYQFEAHSQARPPVALPLEMLRDDPPCSKWQEAGMDFVQRAQRYLWSSKGLSARQYLHSRGFTDDTIKSVHLGYCPGKFIDSLQNWGLEPGQTQKSHITIPEGIVIPWLSVDNLWKIAVKRLQVPPSERSYGQVVGSSDGLYNVDSIRSGRPVVLLEGEFDALSIIQEASDLVAAAATGGATKAQSARWISRLIQASSVLVAFDNDDNAAGDHGADDWLQILPNSLRWSPLEKDVNQMLQEGPYIKPWLTLGLSIALTPPKIEQTQPEPLQPQIAPISSKSQSAPLWPTSAPAVPIRSTNSNPTNSKPTFSCKYCKRAEWIWYSVDAEYICSQCFSPAEWTTKN